MLNQFHKKILRFLDSIWEDESISLMDIGREVGLDHPQKVQDKLDQLRSRWFISKNPFWWYQVMKGLADDAKIYLPFFGFAQCGNAGKAILSEYPRKKLPIDSSLIDLENVESYFITRAKGDSMEPFIQSWDFVLIRIQSVFSNEDKILVVHEWVPKIKKIIKDDNERMRLHSLNKEHKDLIIEEFDELNVVWVVAMTFSSEEYSV